MQESGSVSEKPNLIGQNARDRILTKVQDKKTEEAKKKTEEKIQREHEKKELDLLKHTSNFARTFLRLSNRYFSFKKNEIVNLERDELLELEKLVAQRARRASLFPRMFCAVVPVAGWLTIMRHGKDYYAGGAIHTKRNPRPSRAWTYLYTRHKLMKAHGSDWFPQEEVKSWCLKV